MRRSSQLSKNIVFNAGGGLIVLAGQLLALPIALVAAPPSVYGVWLTVLAVATFLGLFDLGLSASVIRFCGPRTPQVNRTSAATVAGIGSLLLLLFVIPAQLVVGALVLHNVTVDLTKSEDISILVGGIVVAGSGLVTRHWQAYNQSQMRFGTERLHQIIGVVSRLAGVSTVAIMGGGLTEVVVVEIITLALPGLLSLIRNLRPTSGYPSWAPKQQTVTSVRPIISYGLRWFTIAGSTNAAVFGPTVLAGSLGGPQLATAVSAAVRLTSAFRQVQVWAIEPLFPHSIGMSTESQNVLASRAIRVTYGLGLVTILGFVIAGEEFVSRWLGGASDSGLQQDVFSYTLAILISTVAAFLPVCYSAVRQASLMPDVFRWETICWATGTAISYALAIHLGMNDAEFLLPAVAVLTMVPAYFRILTFITPLERVELTRGLGITTFTIVPAGAIGFVAKTWTSQISIATNEMAASAGLVVLFIISMLALIAERRKTKA